jgi:aryl-alcohol dehydrogenase-like predicted oxidoreductase
MKSTKEQGGQGRVDLLQFHWNDYSDKRYLDALRILATLRDGPNACLASSDGARVGGIGLVNFDSLRVEEICSTLGDGVILTNQVQFSLIDLRPLHGMADVCQRHGVKLLTYGSLCGGFLSDKWLHVPEPNRYNEEGGRDPLTPSQKKYLDIIVSAWGSWSLFQQLLVVLRKIGDQHHVSIANVTTRWVLDHDFVGAVLIGARLGVSDNTDDNLAVFGWRLTKEDHVAINTVLSKSNGRKLIKIIGDCGAEYR